MFDRRLDVMWALLRVVHLCGVRVVLRRAVEELIPGGIIACCLLYVALLNWLGWTERDG